MAPILKEAESTVATTAAAAPANPSAKPAVEVPTRPQPVALEIPVTINGAHTVAGSDKREPFSEATQTVLVFGHGAVVRVATLLAPGQLVFLTNEKTKKEVVCQVLKCKSGGSGSNYVELQFTEPAPGFWGLRMPGAPATPPVLATTPAAKPVAPNGPVSLVAPKAAALVAPPVTKTVPVAPKPTTPAAASVAPPEPAKPVIAPSIEPPAAKPAMPVATQPPVPTISAPLISVPPPSPLAAVAEKPAVAAPVVPKPAPPAAVVPDASTPARSGLSKTVGPIPVPPLHDYSKEIEAIFTVRSSTSRPVPAAPAEPKTVAAPSNPSSEQLKQEAARLQAQLSSMLFTEAPSPLKTAPPAPPSTPVVTQAVPEIAKKVLEVVQEAPKSEVLTEPKSAASPARKPAVPLTAEDEEVKIPSWLAPLSQNSEASTAESPAAAVPAEPATEIPRLPEPTFPEETGERSHRPETAVFGGQLLGEATSETGDASSGGSKKGRWIGVAVAVVLLAGGGAWYVRPSLFGSLRGSNAKPASVVPAPAPAVTTTPASENNAVTPAANNTATAALPGASAPVSAKATKNEPVPTPAASQVSAPPAEAKNSAATRNAPPVEPEKKPILGDVHLATPVVSRGAVAQPTSDAPSIDTPTTNAGSNDLAEVAANSHGPAAPLPVGGEVKPAHLIKSVPPVYPMMAKTQHISGNVQLDALVDASGNVAEVKIVSGPSLLHRAALDAVKQWKYDPALLDGQPTSMHLTVTVQFKTQ
jgi:TonB family protein